MFKGKSYKILTLSTLFLPMIILLLYMYISSNNGVEALMESPHVIFPNEISTYDYITDPNNHLEIDIENNKLIFKGEVIIYNDVEIIDGTVVIDAPAFFRVDRTYYTYNYETNEFEVFEHWKLIQDNLVKKGLAGVINLIVGGIGVGIILTILFKKMEWAKLHRRLSVVIYLWTSTLIVLALYLIIENMFLIFLTASISWTLYYIEWYIMRKKNKLPITDQFVSKISIAKEGE